ncbi:methyltransferase domain-containing protein [Methanococcoides sp. FTZ1]|uniref:methyltransferase domain-containing protein n=1 Tax=Methanococcoides sp. FTZ1 TaxID=3439061 RepID=UPI003F83E427
MSRKKNFDNRIKADNDGLRFATPEVVASYRAKRLKCRTIADISCGIGGQTIFFAKECEKVYAIEIDPEKIEFAKKNCERYGLENVEFICGDALSEEIIEQVPKIDILFSDPARPPSEDKRHISSLEPGIPEVLSAYGNKTNNFAFEAPPQMTPDRIPFDCEKEYLSLNGQLNRLNLYFGEIKSCDRSAVALPSEARIDSNYTRPDIVTTEHIGRFACEPEPSVIKAELLPQLAGSIMKHTGSEVELFNIDQKRSLLTSNSPISHPIAKNSYEILQVMELDTSLINKQLKKEDIGTVILRAGVDPERYWDMRNEIEKGLNGSGTVHLFAKDGRAAICRVIG